jgi:hypothetical protein
MNAPAPGWQPDPTGRHEYRYWDGSRWSDDVSDGGVASTDPVAGAPAATQTFGGADQGPPTAPGPTYQAGYDPSGYDSGAGAGYGPGPGGPTSGGYGAGPGTPTSGGYGSGGLPGYGAPPPQPSSGPSTGLLVGLGVLVLVLIVGIGFVVLNSDDDDGGTAIGDETTTTTAGTDPTTTVAGGGDGGDGGGGLGANDGIVSAIAEGIVQGSGGAVDQEGAECMAQAMIDEIGIERLIELGLEAGDGTADPLEVLTSDEQDAVYNAMQNCIDDGSLPELPGG